MLEPVSDCVRCGGTGRATILRSANTKRLPPIAFALSTAPCSCPAGRHLAGPPGSMFFMGVR
jgi:hypothetical protein